MPPKGSSSSSPKDSNEAGTSSRITSQKSIRNKRPSSGKFSFLDLPSNVQIEILARLSDEDLKKFSEIDPKYRQLIETNADYINSEKFQKDGILRGVKGNPKNYYNANCKVSWSSDGTIIASASNDGSINIWDAKTGFPIHTIIGKPDNIYSVSFNKNSKKLAIAGANRGVTIWNIINDADSNKRTISIADEIKNDPKQLTNRIRSIAWSPDDNNIIAIAYDDYINFLDIETKATNFPLLEYYSNVIAWSPDGTMIAAANYATNNITVWKIKEREILKVVEAHSDPITNIRWSPDNTKIASLDKYGFIKIWDVITGDEFNTNPNNQPHAIMNTLDICWTLDGKHIISGDRGGSITFRNIESGMEILILKKKTTENINSLSMNPDSTKIVVGTVNNLVFVQDISKVLLQLGGKTKKYIYKGKSYTIRIGSKGGRYILVGKDKKKFYI